MVIGTTIVSVRGDTVNEPVTVKSSNGSTYTLQTGDQVVLFVKRRYTDDEPVIQKDITSSMAIYLAPDDTAELPWGPYVYECKLLSGTDKYTFLRGMLVLTEEVEREWTEDSTPEPA